MRPQNLIRSNLLRSARWTLREYFSLAMLVVLPAVVAFGVWLERPELILLSALQGVVLPLKEIRGQYCFNDELKVQMSSFSPLSNPEHREAIRTLCWALAAFAASTCVCILCLSVIPPHHPMSLFSEGMVLFLVFMCTIVITDSPLDSLYVMVHTSLLLPIVSSMLLYHWHFPVLHWLFPNAELFDVRPGFNPASSPLFIAFEFLAFAWASLVLGGFSWGEQTVLHTGAGPLVDVMACSVSFLFWWLHVILSPWPGVSALVLAMKWSFSGRVRQHMSTLKRSVLDLITLVLLQQYAVGILGLIAMLITIFSLKRDRVSIISIWAHPFVLICGGILLAFLVDDNGVWDPMHPLSVALQSNFSFYYVDQLLLLLLCKALPRASQILLGVGSLQVLDQWW